MSPELTRRRLLGGVAAGGVTVGAGYEFLPARLLPAPVLELRTERQPIPEVDTGLSVSRAAVESSRDHLREVIDRAESAWDDVDDSDVTSEADRHRSHRERMVETANDQLSEAEGDPANTETLRTLRYGVNRAAWSLGAAKSLSGDYDLDALRDRSESLSADIDGFVDATRYEVADPYRGLAFLHESERMISFARLKADNVPGEDAPAGAVGGNEVVEAVRSLVEGRRWLGDATAVYDAHRSNVADAGNATDLRDHLDGTWRTFDDRIDAVLPDRETAIERYFGDIADGSAQHRAVNELFNNGYMAGDDAYPPSSGPWDGLLAYVTVEYTKALQHALGFEAAVERVARAYADGPVGMNAVARAKRESIRRLRGFLDGADTPLGRTLAARPCEEIAIGDWSLGPTQTFESDRPYAEAYAMNVLAAENLRHTPRVLEELAP